MNKQHIRPEFSEPILIGCADVLRQCAQVLSVITAEHYRTAPVGHSSIGAHVRHGVEHFQQLLAGINCGLIDYDQRDRDLSLEQDLSQFMHHHQGLIAELALLENQPLNATISILQAPGNCVQTRPVASSVERELLFCSSHFMHHLAMIRLIAQLLGVQLSTEIGLAYSTANHLASTPALPLNATGTQGLNPLG
ncbi:MAG: DinB family protein [Sumerlaeia bacterium]